MKEQIRTAIDNWLKKLKKNDYSELKRNIILFSENYEDKLLYYKEYLDVVNELYDSGLTESDFNFLVKLVPSEHFYDLLKDGEYRYIDYYSIPTINPPTKYDDLILVLKSAKDEQTKLKILDSYATTSNAFKLLKNNVIDVKTFSKIDNIPTLLNYFCFDSHNNAHSDSVLYNFRFNGKPSKVFMGKLAKNIIPLIELQCDDSMNEYDRLRVFAISMLYNSELQAILTNDSRYQFFIKNNRYETKEEDRFLIIDKIKETYPQKIEDLVSLLEQTKESFIFNHATKILFNHTTPNGFDWYLYKDRIKNIYDNNYLLDSFEKQNLQENYETLVGIREKDSFPIPQEYVYLLKEYDSHITKSVFKKSRNYPFDYKIGTQNEYQTQGIINSLTKFKKMRLTHLDADNNEILMSWLIFLKLTNRIDKTTFKIGKTIEMADEMLKNGQIDNVAYECVISDLEMKQNINRKIKTI